MLFKFISAVPPQTGGKPAARSYSSSVGITEAQLSASLASLSLQQFPPVASAVASSSHPQQAPAYSIINSNSPRVSYTGGVLPPQQKAEDSIDNSQVAPGPKMSLNYKIALNTYCQKRGIPVPRYDCTYPEDAVGYIVTVHVDGRVFRSKTEGTKRAAESTAASMALQGFGESLGEAATSNGHSVKTEPIVLMKPSSIPGERPEEKDMGRYSMHTELQLIPYLSYNNTEYYKATPVVWVHELAIAIAIQLVCPQSALTTKVHQSSELALLA